MLQALRGVEVNGEGPTALLDALEAKELNMLVKVYDDVVAEQKALPVKTAVCCNCRPAGDGGGPARRVLCHCFI